MGRRKKSSAEREHRLDQRDEIGSRERMAAQRERIADDRERKADQREDTADDRERTADERERCLDELAQELRVLAAGAVRKTVETMEHSRSLAEASKERKVRSEQALERLAAASERQQAAIDRAVAQSERELARPPAGPYDVRGRFEALRKRVADAGIAFAATEENAARIYDDLAAGHNDPVHARTCKQNAEEARAAARRTRALSRQLAG